MIYPSEPFMRLAPKRAISASLILGLVREPVKFARNPNVKPESKAYKWTAATAISTTATVFLCKFIFFSSFIYHKESIAPWLEFRNFSINYWTWALNAIGNDIICQATNGLCQTSLPWQRHKNTVTTPTFIIFTLIPAFWYSSDNETTHRLFISQDRRRAYFRS